MSNNIYDMSPVLATGDPPGCPPLPASARPGAMGAGRWLVEAADAAASAALPLVGDAGGHRESARAKDVGDGLLLGSRWRRHVFVQLPRLRLGEVLVGDGLDDHLLPPGAR